MKILYYSMIRSRISKSFNYLLRTAGFVMVTSTLLNACKTTYKPDPTKSAAQRAIITPSDTLIQKQRKGIDFFAEGNTPVSWALEIDFENNFRFKATDAGLLIAPPVLVTNSATADTYQTKTDAGNMEVTVFKTPCNNNLADKRSKQVEVLINNKKYSGCGSYLYDFRLNDIWVLENIDNNDPVLSKSGKQKPTLEFDLENNRMDGYDGCNIIHSDISVSGNHINFSTISGQKNSCNGNEIKKIFATLLSDHTIDYKIENGRLMIYLINDSKLTFVKSESN